MIKFSDLFSIPNLLSVFRLFLAIPFWILISKETVQEGRGWYIILLCLFGAATDMLDGFLARKMNLVSEMGKIIDPLADKVCIAVIMIKLFISGIVEPVFFYIIIMRDVLIFVSGIFITRKLKRVLPSNYTGKVTVLIISFFIMIVLGNTGHENIFYKLFYFASLAATFISVGVYAVRAFQEIRRVNESV